MEHQFQKKIKKKIPTKHIKSKRKQYISFCTELGAAYQFLYPKEVKSMITDRDSLLNPESNVDFNNTKNS